MELDKSDIDRQAVRREAILPVRRDEAWQALCDAEGLSQWLAEEVELEIRPGATGTLKTHGEERFVTVEEVQPLRKLALRWRAHGKDCDGEESLVELTLDDVDEGTRIVVVEMPVLALRAVAAAFVDSASTQGPQMVATLA